MMPGLNSQPLFIQALASLVLGAVHEETVAVAAARSR
jgi:hypothetical protein